MAAPFFQFLYDSIIGTANSSNNYQGLCHLIWRRSWNRTGSCLVLAQCYCFAADVGLGPYRLTTATFCPVCKTAVIGINNNNNNTTTGLLPLSTTMMNLFPRPVQQQQQQQQQQPQPHSNGDAAPPRYFVTEYPIRLGGSSTAAASSCSITGHIRPSEQLILVLTGDGNLTWIARSSGSITLLSIDCVRKAIPVRPYEAIPITEFSLCIIKGPMAFELRGYGVLWQSLFSRASPLSSSSGSSSSSSSSSSGPRAMWMNQQEIRFQPTTTVDNFLHPFQSINYRDIDELDICMSMLTNGTLIPPKNLVLVKVGSNRYRIETIKTHRDSFLYFKQPDAQSIVVYHNDDDIFSCSFVRLGDDDDTYDIDVTQRIMKEESSEFTSSSSPLAVLVARFGAFRPFITDEDLTQCITATRRPSLFDF